MSKPLASDHANPIVEVENLNMFYGETQTLHHIDLSIPEREVTAFYRTFGLRQINALALPQSPQRPSRIRAH